MDWKEKYWVFLSPDYLYKDEDWEAVFHMLDDVQAINHRTWNFPEWFNLELLEGLEQSMNSLFDQLAGKIELWGSTTNKDDLAPINRANPILTQIKMIKDIFSAKEVLENWVENSVKSQVSAIIWEAGRFVKEMYEVVTWKKKLPPLYKGDWMKKSLYKKKKRG